MYLSQIVNRIRWSTAVLACFTMAISPLAAAKESANISRAQIENYINATGLNKNSTTWAQFYEATKDNYPEHVAQKIGEFVKLNPNLPMPTVKLKSAQSAQGDSAMVLEVFDKGKTYTIQVIGEQDKWAKISGITLKESDLENPANALIRLQTGNIFFKKDADAFLAKHNLLPDQKTEQLKANLSLFKNFPRMTPQLWSSMTKSQRKDFIKQITDVWRAAEEVLNAEPKKGKKTSLLENYLRYFLGPAAFAEEGTAPAPMQGPVPVASADQVAPTAGAAAGSAEAPATTTQQRTLQQMERELSSNPDLLRAYQSGTWTPELDRWLVQFEVSAERRAQEAVNTCVSRVSTIRMDSSDVQRAACEDFGRQLLINETVISQFRDRSCRAPAQYIGKYSAGESAASRDQKDQLNRRDIDASQEQLCSCAETSARVKFNEDCPAAGSVANAQPPATSDQQDADGSQNRRSRDSSFWPLIIGGAAVGVLAGLLFFGKDKKKNRTTASAASSAAPACPANQVGTPPNCSCGPCTSPQQVYNFVTCQCTNITNNVICPNNEMAPNGDSSKCQKCSDGTYKTTEPCPQVTPPPTVCSGANCGGVRPAIQ